MYFFRPPKTKLSLAYLTLAIVSHSISVHAFRAIGLGHMNITFPQNHDHLHYMAKAFDIIYFIFLGIGGYIHDLARKKFAPIIIWLSLAIAANFIFCISDYVDVARFCFFSIAALSSAIMVGLIVYGAAEYAGYNCLRASTYFTIAYITEIIGHAAAIRFVPLRFLIANNCGRLSCSAYVMVISLLFEIIAWITFGLCYSKVKAESKQTLCEQLPKIGRVLVVFAPFLIIWINYGDGIWRWILQVELMVCPILWYELSGPNMLIMDLIATVICGIIFLCAFTYAKYVIMRPALIILLGGVLMGIGMILSANLYDSLKVHKHVNVPDSYARIYLSVYNDSGIINRSTLQLKTTGFHFNSGKLLFFDLNLDGDEACYKINVTILKAVSDSSWSYNCSVITPHDFSNHSHYHFRQTRALLSKSNFSTNSPGNVSHVFPDNVKQYFLQILGDSLKYFSHMFVRNVSQNFSRNVSHNFPPNDSHNFEQNVSQNYSLNISQNFPPKDSQKHLLKVIQNYARNVSQPFSPIVLQNVSQNFPPKVSQKHSLKKVIQNYATNVSQIFSPKVLQNVSQNFPPKDSQKHSLKVIQNYATNVSQFFSPKVLRNISLKSAKKFPRVLSQSCLSTLPENTSHNYSMLFDLDSEKVCLKERTSYIFNVKFLYDKAYLKFQPFLFDSRREIYGRPRICVVNSGSLFTANYHIKFQAVNNPEVRYSIMANKNFTCLMMKVAVYDVIMNYTMARTNLQLQYGEVYLMQLNGSSSTGQFEIMRVQKQLTVSAWYLVPLIFIVAFGKICIIVTGMYVIYTQVPILTKGTAIGCWLMFTSIGLTTNEGDNIKHPFRTSFMFTGVLIILMTVLFYCLYICYAEWNFTCVTDTPTVIEDSEEQRRTYNTSESAQSLASSMPSTQTLATPRQSGPRSIHSKIVTVQYHRAPPKALSKMQ